MLYQRIASSFRAYLNCIESGNSLWKDKHELAIFDLCRSELPSGSGFDNGTNFSFDESKPNKLVFVFSFHHMDENGCYDGWTHHKLIVKPDLAFGFTLHITGPDRNGFKEYAYDTFNFILSDKA